MSREPVVIYSAANAQQAHLLKGLLQEQGIPAWVVNDAIQIAGGDLPLGWPAAARVVVSDDDAEVARQFAEDFDLQTAHDSTDDVVDDSPLTPWADWPLCPTCGARQSARCSVCGTSGTDFPLADVQTTETGSAALFKCDACDDLFLPQWYRLCPQCGHDYGSGIEIGDARRVALEINAATLGVLLGLLAGAAALIAYFVWLFS